MNVHVFHRDLLLAFAAVAIEGVEQHCEAARELQARAAGGAKTPQNTIRPAMKTMVGFVKSTILGGFFVLLSLLLLWEVLQPPWVALITP
jgi:hypothetical protein